MEILSSSEWDNGRMKTIQLKAGKERSLKRQHPWIFESAGYRLPFFRLKMHPSPYASRFLFFLFFFLGMLLLLLMLYPFLKDVCILQLVSANVWLKMEYLSVGHTISIQNIM